MLIRVFQIKSPSTIFKYVKFTTKALTPEEKLLPSDGFWMDLQYFYPPEYIIFIELSKNTGQKSITSTKNNKKHF